MKILSIETSCDETGISILEANGGVKKPSFEVLANNLNSQIKIHAPYGGVYPALAKREHLKNLPILLEKILKETKIKKVDLIAVTYGPGLEPALWTGIVFAKDLAKKWNVPLIGVNHMEGHMLSVFGKNKGLFGIPKIEFPALSLLVSGGHTELVLATKWQKYKIIGETLDDAAGEAFDKVARMLELPYPGGPEISKLAEKERKNLLDILPLSARKFSAENFLCPSSTLLPRLPDATYLRKSKNEVEEQSLQGVRSATGARLQQFSSKKIAYPEKISSFISLPRPMLHSKNFDFSFSGLKTAVLYLIRDLKKENPNILQDEKTKMAISKEFEDAVVETLVHKTKKAIEKYHAKTIIVAGGVSGNKHLQNQMKKIISKENKLLFPNKDLSTDNSIMIGMVGYFRYLEKGGKLPKNPKIKAQGGLRL